MRLWALSVVASGSQLRIEIGLETLIITHLRGSLKPQRMSARRCDTSDNVTLSHPSTSASIQRMSGEWALLEGYAHSLALT